MVSEMVHVDVGDFAQCQELKPDSSGAASSKGDPHALALFSFGMTNFLMGVCTLRGALPDGLLIGQAFLFAGCSQNIAGIMDFICGCTYGTFLSLSFGGWWYSFVASFILPEMGWGEQMAGSGMLVFVILSTIQFALSTSIMASEGRQHASSITLMALVVVICFFNSIATGGPDFLWATMIVGALCVASGLVGFYAASACILNSSYKRTILPLGF